MEMEKKHQKRRGTSIPLRGIYSEEARQKRLEFLEKNLKINTEVIRETNLNSNQLQGNIENFVGSVEVPVGVAGPLLINFQDQSQELIYAPIATTEGALVSSICRGARALSMTDGVKTRVLRSVMTRSPVFFCDSMESAAKLSAWVRDHEHLLKEKVKDYSNHARLIGIDHQIIARSLHLRFKYDTGDAAGQNMSTVCTWNICNWAIEKVREETDISEIDFHIESNLSSDKKASFMSSIVGRGKEVVSEAIIKKEHFERILRYDVKSYIKHLNMVKNYTGYTGGLGSNVNVANVIAGIFTATGQDIACVHESSIGHIFAEETASGDLYVYMHLPCLVVGTVGGGVSLPGPKSFLDMMGAYGQGKSSKFAQIIAGYCLALDLSTSSSVFNGSFAQAHQRLGRNYSVNWLKRLELNEVFFNEHLHFDDNDVVAIKENPNFNTDQSLVTDLVKPITKRVTGLFRYDVELSHGVEKKKDIVLKIKPTDKEITLAFLLLTGLEDTQLKETLKVYENQSIFKNCHVREQIIYRRYQEKFPDLFPKNCGLVIDHNRELYVIANDYIDNAEFLSPDTVFKYDKAKQYITSAIGAITPFHAHNYDKDFKSSASWLGVDYNTNKLLELEKVWRALLVFGREKFPEMISEAQYDRHSKVIDEIAQWSIKTEAMTKTLIHNDFNTRNLCFQFDTKKTCALDWELATLGLPQRDILELIAYMTDASLTMPQLSELINYHRQKFEAATGKNISGEDWLEGCKSSLKQYLIHNLSLYFIAHSHKECVFLGRVYKQVLHLLQLLEEYQL